MKARFTATPYLFLAPALALIAVFVLYPILAVIYYSFTDYNIINPPIWVGLDNYGKLLADPVARRPEPGPPDRHAPHDLGGHRLLRRDLRGRSAEHPR